MQQELIVAVSRTGSSSISGVFYRHTSPDRNPRLGSASGGRWGTPGSYSVLYLGRPTDSVVVEAYRHLVDDDEDLTGEMVGPRKLWTVGVTVTNVLDLRPLAAQATVGLDLAALTSDVDEYAPCQRVAQAAHQLGMHGVIAPAATRLGETLALFIENLPATEFVDVRDETQWPHLPPDPRKQLRVVAEDAESA